MQHDFMYISKRDPQVKAAYNDLMCLLRDVRIELQDKYTFQHRLVGSYSRNMITYDTKSNVGFDFDVNIYPNDEDDLYSPKQIKLWFKHALDRYVKDYSYDYAEDSTRVLTIKVKDKKTSRVVYSVDFAFVNDYIDDEGYEHQEYILFNKKTNIYSWEEQSDGYYMLSEKIDWMSSTLFLELLNILFAVPFFRIVLDMLNHRINIFYGFNNQNTEQKLYRTQSSIFGHY